MVNIGIDYDNDYPLVIHLPFAQVQMHMCTIVEVKKANNKLDFNM